VTKRTSLIAVLGVFVALGAPLAVQAQSAYEDFTGTTTQNSWYFLNGACLTAATTAGVQPSGGAGGQIPGCTAIGSSYYGQNLVGGQNGVTGTAQTLPDPVGQGALRFTNGYPYGYGQNGAIISATPFSTGQGISVAFKTVTYRGNSGGAGGDGADGMSFFLMDASQPPNIGAWGGSLGYSCSNVNNPKDGLVGAYLGVGIDEYGNFLNGATLMPGYTGTNNATGDNSALGYGYRPGRIGLRGAGNIAWSWLNANYPTYYPSTFSPAQQQSAVQATCQNGVVWDLVNNQAATSGGATIPLYDYAPIPGAYVELPSTTKIANEATMNRGGASVIFYNLKITQNGLLSFSYSINGGAYQRVITNQNITAANGPVPANFLFGFAGSTGGSTNIHEILCFQADPETSAAASAGVSEKESSALQTGVQAYFAFYNPSNWTGRVTASSLGLDSFGNIVIAQTPNWDASCTLTGVAAGKLCKTTLVAGPIPAQAPTSRTILTWNGTSGVPFEWGSITSGEQSTLDAGDPTPINSNRLAYLRGDRTNEVTSLGVGLYRARSSVLGDIIDSSPIWVGPPIAPYPATWTDRIHSSASMLENAGQTYPQYVTAAQTRLNVVYVGSDDGLVHGFRTGSFDANNNFVPNFNDGAEVLAYMPGAIVQTIHSTTANVDYANTQYGHQFFVDATPATGDVFYGGQWHSWLVGGLGPGGSAIFALDVTNPSASNFTEGNAANLVVGEWTSATINCANVGSCGNNMGLTYGTPVLRRLHDGKWAVIFGNGYGSASGDGGIYIMTIDPNSGSSTFYYLSSRTGSASNPNGIAYVTAVDLDGDHITDYVYAGDLQGNIWRFDLTSTAESAWILTPGPLFKAPGGQPITTAVVAASGAPSTGMAQQLMILFGTGQRTPLTNTSPALYANGTQSLYGVWDWNMSAWNALSSTTQYASMAPGATGLSGNYTVMQANLQAQTATINPTTQNRDIASNATICWAGQTGCVPGKFGWYLNLPGLQEQVVYTPQLVGQAFTFNTVVPAPNIPTACTSLTDVGYTYIVSALTGGAFNEVFLPPSEVNNTAVNTDPRYTDTAAIAMQTNATGTAYILDNSAGTRFLVYETNQAASGGNGANIGSGALGLNLPPNTAGRRLTWTSRR